MEWIPNLESVLDNRSTLSISCHTDSISLQLLLKEMQKSFIPLFHHYEAIVAILTWSMPQPTDQSIKQNRHRFWEQRVKEALHSNKKLFLISSGVFLPTVSQGQEQEISVHYSHPPSNLWRYSYYFHSFWQSSDITLIQLDIWPKNSKEASALFSFCLFFILKKH